MASEFLPSFFGCEGDITRTYRKLAELPVRYGGLSLYECHKSLPPLVRSIRSISIHSGYLAFTLRRGYASILES